MRITDVRVQFPDTAGDGRLLAFVSLVLVGEPLGQLVVHDLKVIQGDRGLFVSMPSRPVRCCCQLCGWSGPVYARFCADCGAARPEDRCAKLYYDIIHPVDAATRAGLHGAVLGAYAAALVAREARPT